MFLNRQNAQVLNPIVAGVPVDMVDLLPRLQPPTEMDFHDVSVFTQSPTIDGNSLIRPVVIGALRDRVAASGAEPLSDSAGTDSELSIAHSASPKKSGEVMSRSASNGGQTRTFYLGKAGLSKAAARAEANERFPYTVSPNMECLLAVFADDFNQRSIVSQKQAVAIALDVARRSRKKRRTKG